MSKIAVIGDIYSVLGFKALGLDVYAATDAEGAAEKLHQLAKSGYAIIYLTEDLAADCQEDIDQYKDLIAPAIILIPGKGGSLGLGKQALNQCVERAVGTNILA